MPISAPRTLRVLMVPFCLAIPSFYAFCQEKKATVPAEKKAASGLPLSTVSKTAAPRMLEVSLAGGVQSMTAKGLLFKPSDTAQTIGSQSDLSIKIFPFSKLGQSQIYSMLGFSGRLQFGQTNAADINDGSVGEKVGYYKLKQREMQAGLLVRLALLNNTLTPRVELSPSFRIQQTPEISGPLSKAAVLNYQARGLGTSLGLNYRTKGAFEFDLNALFGTSMQGHSTNISVDEVTSTSVNLQKASLFRISERTSYIFKNFFSCLDISFASFDVTIPQDDIPSRTISQKTTAAAIGVGAFL